MHSAESGDSSVVTRWTVDQEVVGSNPTHGGLTGLSLPNGLITIDRRRLHPWA